MAVQLTVRHFPVPAGGENPSAGDGFPGILAGETGSWRICAASAAGSRHERQRLPNQDAAGYRVTADGFVIAVSDGAGSAEYSDQGSRLAVSAALESLLRSREQPLSDALQLAMSDARTAVVALAQQAGRNPRKYAATLSLAVTRHNAFGSIQTGDGAVVIAGADGVYSMTSAPSRGEYANSTEFITGNHWQMPAATVVDEGAERVLVTTDGMLNLIMKLQPVGVYEPYPPFHDAVFGWLAAQAEPGSPDSYLELRGLLRSAKTRARTDDDVTLVIASRNKPRRPDS